MLIVETFKYFSISYKKKFIKINCTFIINIGQKVIKYICINLF